MQLFYIVQYFSYIRYTPLFDTIIYYLVYDIYISFAKYLTKNAPPEK